MVYKPLAVRVALVAGFRQALPVFKYMIVVAVAVVMWESPQGFPRDVGRVESRLYGFPCFPHPGISMASFLAVWVFMFQARSAMADQMGDPKLELILSGGLSLSRAAGDPALLQPMLFWSGQ
jgi:hypothetical protein